jgi:hypothetical protein
MVMIVFLKGLVRVREQLQQHGQMRLAGSEEFLVTRWLAIYKHQILKKRDKQYGINTVVSEAQKVKMHQHVPISFDAILLIIHVRYCRRPGEQLREQKVDLWPVSSSPSPLPSSSVFSAGRRQIHHRHTNSLIFRIPPKPPVIFSTIGGQRQSRRTAHSTCCRRLATLPPPPSVLRSLAIGTPGSRNQATFIFPGARAPGSKCRI